MLPWVICLLQATSPNTMLSGTQCRCCCLLLHSFRPNITPRDHLSCNLRVCFLHQEELAVPTAQFYSVTLSDSFELTLVYSIVAVSAGGLHRNNWRPGTYVAKLVLRRRGLCLLQLPCDHQLI